MEKKIIGVVGPKNMAIGEDHANAKLTDARVEEMRTLYETGNYGYRRLAAMFGVHRATVRDIVTFRRRACTPDAYKPVYRPTMTAPCALVARLEDFDDLNADYYG